MFQNRDDCTSLLGYKANKISSLKRTYKSTASEEFSGATRLCSSIRRQLSSKISGSQGKSFIRHWFSNSSTSSMSTSIALSIPPYRKGSLYIISGRPVGICVLARLLRIRCRFHKSEIRSSSSYKKHWLEYIPVLFALGLLWPMMVFLSNRKLKWLSGRNVDLEASLREFLASSIG